MEKLLDTFVEEIAQRVLKKLSEDTTRMHEFLRVKIKPENIEGLEDFIAHNDAIKTIIADAVEETAKDAGYEAGKEAGEEAVDSFVKNASFEVSVST